MGLKKIVRDVLWVTGGNWVALAAGVPLGLLTPLFLAPAAYGIIGLVDSIAEFLRHYPLGSLSAVGRDMPLLRGRGETRAADDARDAGWTLTVVLGLPAALVPAALARWVFHAGADLQLALLLAGIATTVWRLGEIHAVFLRASQRFREDSRVVMIAALIQLPLLPLALWTLGMPGYYVSSAAVAVVSYFLWSFASEEKPRLRLAPGALAALLSFGAPVALLEIAESAVAAIDRPLLKRVFSLEMLGLYFFAFKFNRYVLALPQAIAVVAQRRLVGMLAGRAEKDCVEAVHQPAMFTAWGTGLLAAGAAAVLPALVSAIYPRFNPAIPAIRIFLVAAWWPAVGGIYLRHLVATGRMRPALASSAIAIAFVVTGFLWRGSRLDLESASLIAGGGMALRGVLATVLSTAALARSTGEIPRRLLPLLPPFLLLFALVWEFQKGWPRIGGPLPTALLQGAFAALLFIPGLVVLSRRHRLFEESP